MCFIYMTWYNSSHHLNIQKIPQPTTFLSLKNSEIIKWTWGNIRYICMYYMFKWMTTCILVTRTKYWNNASVFFNKDQFIYLHVFLCLLEENDYKRQIVQDPYRKSVLRNVSQTVCISLQTELTLGCSKGHCVHLQYLPMGEFTGWYTEIRPL